LETAFQAVVEPKFSGVSCSLPVKQHLFDPKLEQLIGLGDAVSVNV
jgi:hypothetical protein